MLTGILTISLSLLLNGCGRAKACKEDKVNCGGHRAANCALCPQGHGRIWCNGECSWDDTKGVCYRISPDMPDLLVAEPDFVADAASYFSANK